MGKESKIKILAITLITVMLMGISSITIYSNVCVPKLYDYFIDTGIKYLNDGKYEEAILAFEKAIKIEAKSTEARVYLAEAYVRNNEQDKAIEVLEAAQKIDMKNEVLLKDIINILYEVDEDVEDEFLDRFINEVGKDNIPDSINKILDSSNESQRKANENNDVVESIKSMWQTNTGSKIQDTNKPVALPEEYDDVVESIKSIGQMNTSNKTSDKSNKPVALPEEGNDVVETLNPIGQMNTSNKTPNESNKPVALPEEGYDVVEPLKPMGQMNTSNKIPNGSNKPVALPE